MKLLSSLLILSIAIPAAAKGKAVTCPDLTGQYECLTVNTKKKSLVEYQKTETGYLVLTTYDDAEKSQNQTELKLDKQPYVEVSNESRSSLRRSTCFNGRITSELRTTTLPSEDAAPTFAPLTLVTSFCNLNKKKDLMCDMVAEARLMNGQIESMSLRQVCKRL